MTAMYQNVKWIWICRDCKKEYPETGEGLLKKKDSGKYTDITYFTCECGGVVDLFSKIFNVGSRHEVEECIAEGL